MFGSGEPVLLQEYPSIHFFETMKGYGISMPPVNAGIASDMESLLEAFKTKQSVRLVKFHEVVFDYQLNTIYAGRLSLAELIEFEECLLKAAFAYTSPTKGSKGGSEVKRTLTERVFGVYATYVLYYSQPIDYVSKINVTSNEVLEIVRFCQEVLLPGRHLDTVACLYKLAFDDAFSVVAYVNSYDPICHRRYDMPNPDDDIVDEDEKHVPLAEASALMDDPILKTMARVQEKMENKQRVTEGCPKVAEIKDNFLTRITKIYAALKNDMARVDTGDIEEPNESGDAITVMEQRGATHAQLTTSSSSQHLPVSEGVETQEPNRSSIKDRAYSSKITFSRNRRYADPNMHDNFAELFDDDNLLSLDKPILPDSVKSPTKKRKRKTNDAIVDAALARVAALEGTAAEGMADNNETVEIPSTSKDRTKLKAPRKPKVKNAKGDELGSDLDSVGASTIDALESAILGTPSSPQAKAKSKTPRQRKAKKSKTAEPTAILASLDRSPTKKGKPVPPPVDADFEQKLKILEESLATSNDDERVKDLLG